mmetsp:Transcript_9588/g.22075  ORF Transcript_9588/g.22075 Transcript_9588/m.22075 type:complete len:383 (+) Transcript_9588:263-1411(+)
MGDDLRENMQLEKLKALKPVGEFGADAMNRKLPNNKLDPKIMGKELEEEVNERVRTGTRAEGEHCTAWVKQAEAIAKSEKKQSDFTASKSATPLEIFVTVHLKAKNLKRLLAKVAMLADVCMQRGIPGSGNYDVYQDSKGHFKADFEVKCAPENMERKPLGLSSNQDGKLPHKLPSLMAVEASGKKGKVANGQVQQKQLQDGSVYRGGLKDGKPHGFGSVTYSDDDPKQRVKFAGEFEDGIRKGSGCLVWKDGAQYAGDWFGDKPSGFGVENYPDGSSYIGQYEDDMRHGYGTYTFPSGAKYEGCWFMGKRHGKALEQSKKGAFCVEFDNNKRTNNTEFVPGQNEEFDLLVARVRAAVERGKESGDNAAQSFEQHFQTKIRR